ncbi:hypothetical protein GCM10022402_39060 [Salinactinospora qingdaonensis]|uniref:Uncharacterized protein n=1 Tax=Salinactinospora qingdaonensis TaxID=702744 RepID=A0ABP7G8W2_9ACTN
MAGPTASHEADSYVEWLTKLLAVFLVVVKARVARMTGPPDSGERSQQAAVVRGYPPISPTVFSPRRILLRTRRRRAAAPVENPGRGTPDTR